MNKYFAYIPEEGFSVFPDKQGAIAAVSDYLISYQETAEIEGEWSDEYQEACWGVIKQRGSCETTVTFNLEDV